MKSDNQRDHWELVPLVSVGPLRFGASHDEVVAALDHAHPSCTIGDSQHDSCVEAQFRRVGVTVYYPHERAYCIAVDALRGPQVTLDGGALVGRVPSQVEQWLWADAAGRGWQVGYSHAADPELVDLGLIIRAQRAGDVVLTRPVLLDQRSEVSWDYVPGREWTIF